MVGEKQGYLGTMKRYSIVFLIAFAMLGITVSPIFAQDEYPIDEFEKECIKKDSTTAGMANCTYEAQKKWDSELNKYYKMLLSLLDNKDRNQLRESQRIWLDFRNAEFKTIKSFYEKMEGTMFISMRSANYLSIVKERALQLKEYYELLKESGYR